MRARTRTRATTSRTATTKETTMKTTTRDNAADDEVEVKVEVEVEVSLRLTVRLRTRTRGRTRTRMTTYVVHVEAKSLRKRHSKRLRQATHARKLRVVGATLCEKLLWGQRRPSSTPMVKDTRKLVAAHGPLASGTLAPTEAILIAADTPRSKPTTTRCRGARLIVKGALSATSAVSLKQK